jgi:glycosyltransferase involved in cell wall biosynthesis
MPEPTGPHAPAASGPSITLVMIVRDESAVIERCLASVRPLLSNWVIVDTGSTDDTAERIEAALAGVPGTLHHRPWVDFGTNRSELMELARGVGTHLLLLDADMTVRIEGPATIPSAEAALLRHEGDPAYWIPRLVRAELPWSFVGPTHEHLACEVPHRSERLDWLVIEHHADGGSRGDKLERDRRLLEAALERHPDDSRSVFYLAQTLRDMGLTAEAIELYRRRVRLGGWIEEVFYAQLQVGVLTAGDDWFAAVPELLGAWELRPARAEPLLELARGYRTRGAPHLARHFAALGLDIPYPDDDLLFVHPEAYEWALRFEHAIAAYHCGDAEAALADNDRLLTEGVPPWVEPWVRHNRAWCLHALGRGELPTRALLPAVAGEPGPILAELAPSTRMTLLDVPDPRGWSTFNPSVANDAAGRLHVVVRSSNYHLGPGGTYEFADADDAAASVVRTANRLVTLDEQLRPTASAVLPDVPPGAEVHPSQVVGCEDLRLVHVDGRWRATATVRDRNPDWRCEIALLDLGASDDPTAPGGTTLRLLAGPDPARHEKNWMPFVHDGDLHVLYLCSPTTVLRVGDDGAAEVVSQAPGPPGLSDARGGSQGLPVEGGHLFVVHEATVGGHLGRVYAHRLVLLTELSARGGADGAGGWAITAASPPFQLLEPTIEFCAGLARHPGAPDRVVLSFGHADASAWLADVVLDELLALLEPTGV